MQQSPAWEANRFSASQNIPRILWNPMVQYRVLKCQRPAPNLSHLDPVHASISHFLKIHLNVILTYTRGCRVNLLYLFYKEGRIEIKSQKGACNMCYK